MLFPLAMTRYCCVENWSYPLTFIIPSWVVCFRHLSHESSIHNTQSFISVYFYWLKPVFKSSMFWCVSTILALIPSCFIFWWFVCSKTSSHCLSKLMTWLNFIRLKLFRLLNIFSLNIFIQNDLMNSLFLLSRLSSINYGKVVNIKFKLYWFLFLFLFIISDMT